MANGWSEAHDRQVWPKGPLPRQLRGLHPKKIVMMRMAKHTSCMYVGSYTPLTKPAADIPSTRSKSSLIYYAYAHYSIAAMDKTIKFVYQYEMLFANQKFGKEQGKLMLC